MAARNFSNIAVETILSSGIMAGATTLTVDVPTGWPAAPFGLIIDEDEPTEELIIVGNKSGNVFSSLTRGFGGTSAANHSGGAIVRHVVMAEDLAQIWAHNHGGADGSALITHDNLSGVSIDDHHARDHQATHQVGGADPLSGLLDAQARVGARKNSAGTTFVRRRINFIEGADITIAVGDDVGSEEIDVTISAGVGGGAIVPPGVICPYGGTSAPPGWLMCDGAAVSQSTFAALFAIIGTTYGNPGGGNFNVPDLRQRFPLGKAASGTGSTLGGTGGSIDHTHTGPSHTHTGPGHTHAMNQHSHSGPSHNHLGGDHQHSGPSHIHTMPTHTHSFSATSAGAGSHDHAFSGHDTTSAGSHSHSFSDTTSGASASIDRAPGAGPVATSAHTHTVSGTTGAGGSHVHEMNVPSMTNPGNHSHTVSGTSGATDPGDTNAAGTGLTGAAGSVVTGASGTGSTSTDGDTATAESGTGATGAGGTGATGVGNPPFQVVNYIIKT